MPLRAFVDSDKMNYTLAWFLPMHVLMPLRAFVDSDDNNLKSPIEYNYMS